MKKVNFRVALTIIIVVATLQTLSAFCFEQQKEKKAATQNKKEQKITQIAQENSKINELLISKYFSFVAQRVYSSMPRANSSLDGSYSLEVSGDIINSYLPFFGRMDSVPYGGDTNPMRFKAHITSYDKTGAVTGKRKEKAVITIKANQDDGNNNYELILEVFSQESASLRVIQQNGESISYGGYITQIDNK